MGKLTINCNERKEDYIEIENIKKHGKISFFICADEIEGMVITTKEDSVKIAGFILEQNGYNLDGFSFAQQGEIYNLKQELAEALRLNQELAKRLETEKTEPQPSEKDTFYMCYAKSKNTPAKVHNTYLAAELESHRLCNKLEVDTYILKAVAQYTPVKTVTIMKTNAIELPK